MSDAAADPTPPEELPDDTVSQLQQLTAEELRNAIIYTHELLHAQAESGPIVEPAPGEEIVRVTEHEGHTEVVKKQPCGEDCEDCPHGPYLYHVKELTTPTGETKLFWTLLGEVYEDD